MATGGAQSLASTVTVGHSLASSRDGGTPLVARIEPATGRVWVAMFAAGGLGSFRGAFSTPMPQLLAVVVNGLAYLVNVEHPESAAEIVHEQVHQVVPC